MDYNNDIAILRLSKSFCHYKHFNVFLMFLLSLYGSFLMQVACHICTILKYHCRLVYHLLCIVHYYHIYILHKIQTEQYRRHKLLTFTFLSSL